MIGKTFGANLMMFISACHYIKYHDVEAAVELYTSLMIGMLVLGICVFAASAVFYKGTLAEMKKEQGRITVFWDSIVHLVVLITVLLTALFVI